MSSALTSSRLALTPSPIRAILARGQQPGVIALAGGLPDAALFPVAELTAAAGAALADPRCLQYAASEGLPELRAWVAQRLRGRGLTVDAGRVFITNGSQHGLQLALRILAGPGDAIALEAPAYPGARQAAELSGALVLDAQLADGRLVADDELARLAAAARAAGATLRALVAMPTARNPTGVTLTAGERQALAAGAARHDLALVEDDAYADLWYAAPPPPAVASWHGRTILSGSFSKILAPGLRLGWLCVPADLADAAGLALQATCLHANGLAQHTLWQWLRRDGLDAHLDLVRATYRARRDTLAAALRRHLPRLAVTLPDGGMFLWLRLPAGCGGAALAAAALERDLTVVHGGAFHAGGLPDDHLRLSFASLGPAVLDEGVARLAEALHAVP